MEDPIRPDFGQRWLSFQRVAGFDPDHRSLRVGGFYALDGRSANSALLVTGVINDESVVRFLLNQASLEPL